MSSTYQDIPSTWHSLRIDIITDILDVHVIVVFSCSLWRNYYAGSFGTTAGKRNVQKQRQCIRCNINYYYLFFWVIWTQEWMWLRVHRGFCGVGFREAAVLICVHAAVVRRTIVSLRFLSNSREVCECVITARSTATAVVERTIGEPTPISAKSNLRFGCCGLPSMCFMFYFFRLLLPHAPVLPLRQRHSYMWGWIFTFLSLCFLFGRCQTPLH